jgi:hypothetical protein
LDSFKVIRRVHAEQWRGELGPHFESLSQPSDGRTVCDNFSIFAARAAHLLGLGLPLGGIRVMPSTRSPFPDQPTIALDHRRTVDTVSKYS